MKEEALVRIFTEWDLRYRNNPEEFMTQVDHLIKNSPYSYGLACGRYFKQLAEEMGEI